jgi:hypothetical protein
MTMVQREAPPDADRVAQTATHVNPGVAPVTSSVASPIESPRPGTAAAIVIGVVATIAVLGLFVAGVTFLGLAIAFPIAGQVAADYHVTVSAADLALADRLAGFWWLFGLLSVGSVAAAVVVAVKTIERLSPNAND